MTDFFDGKTRAKEIQFELKRRVEQLRESGVHPKLVSILVGEDKAGELYVNLKRKRGEEIGVKVEVKRLNLDLSVGMAGTKSEIKRTIEQLNEDPQVHGIMIQLPLPEKFTSVDRDKTLERILPDKDVDGMRKKSRFVTPVVKAVLEAISKSHIVDYKALKTVIVGASGFEGKKIFKKLENLGYNVEGVNSKTKYMGKKTSTADILISATGVPGLISSDKVKRGAVIIDVGSPYGDVKSDEVMQKASFISAVPGGIGPVTISCLLENLCIAAELSLKKA